MTCVIAVRRGDGSLILCADCCVSWKFLHRKDERYIYRDELQKLYFPVHNVCIAVVGDLLPAQKLLKKLREVFDNGVLNKRLKNGCSSGVMLKRVVPGLIKYLWKTEHLNGKVYLAIGVDDLRCNRALVIFSSLKPCFLQSVKEGEVVILGSVNNDNSLISHLEYKIKQIDLLRHQGKPLNMQEYLALFTNELTTCFSNNKSREQGIGGLFQITYSNRGFFIFGEFNSRSITTEKGMIYNVSLIWDENQNRWIQRDENTGYEVKLLRLDEAKFEKKPGCNRLFFY